jgi:hypothetical protein
MIRSHFDDAYNSMSSSVGKMGMVVNGNKILYKKACGYSSTMINEIQGKHKSNMKMSTLGLKLTKSTFSSICKFLQLRVSPNRPQEA